MEAYDSYEHAGVTVEIVRDDDPTSPQDNDNAGTLYSWTREFGEADEQIGEPGAVTLCPKCQGEGQVPVEYWPGGRCAECRWCGGDGEIPCSVEQWFEERYDAVLTIPLRYETQSYGRIYESDDPNCALVFTQKEIDYEWSGHLDPYPVEMKNAGSLTGEVREYGGARSYAKARIGELDQYFQGNVWVVRIRERKHLTSCDMDGYCNFCGYQEEDADCEKGEILESCGGFIGEPDAEWIREEANGMAEDASERLREEAEEVAYWAARGVVTR